MFQAAPHNLLKHQKKDNYSNCEADLKAKVTAQRIWMNYYLLLKSKNDDTDT